MIKLGRDICYINWLASRLFGPSTLHFKANPLKQLVHHLITEYWFEQGKLSWLNDEWTLTPECHPKEIIHQIAAFLKRQAGGQANPTTIPHEKTNSCNPAKPWGGLPRVSSQAAQELRIIERLDVHIRQLGKTITSRGMEFGLPKPYRCCLQWWVNHPKNGWWPIMQKTPINPWRIWGVPFFFWKHNI